MRKEFRKPWTAIGEEGFKVFQQLNRGYDFRVLMAFLERMNEQNLFIGSQAELAKDLGMTRQSVSTTFRRLEEQGLLLKTNKNGVTLFQLNLNLARKVHIKVRVSDKGPSIQDFLDEWQEAIDQHRADPNYKPLKPNSDKPRKQGRVTSKKSE